MATRYVLPNANHLPGGTGTGDGLTPATAWSSWANVIWGGSGTGVKGGDILQMLPDAGWTTQPAILSVGNHGATVGNPCIIDGTNVELIFVTPSHYLWNTRPNTVIRNFKRIQSIVPEASGTNTDIIGNAFECNGAASCIRMSSTGGVTTTNLRMLRNTFTSIAAPASASICAVGWLVTPGQSAFVNGFTFEDNIVRNFESGRALVHLRAYEGTTRAKDFIIRRNKFIDYVGLAINIEAPGPDSGVDSGVFGTSDWSEGMISTDNEFINGVTNAGNFGGAMFFSGFGDSTTPGFGPNIIARNKAVNIQGDAGFIDILYGKHQIFDNYCDGVRTNNIDGNGILFDIGSHDSYAWNNIIRNCSGIPGMGNTGCGIMQLPGANNVGAFGNIFDRCLQGIFYGALGASASSRYNANVFLNCIENAVLIAGSAGSQLANCSATGNFFTGTGNRVRNNGATPWRGDIDNQFYGFANGNTGHTTAVNSTVGAMRNIALTLADPATARPIAGAPSFNLGGFLVSAMDESMRPFDMPVRSDSYVPMVR